MKHTPGPWRTVSNNERGIDIRDTKRKDGSSLLIAEVFEITDRDENAALMAAAPELLEALEYALQSVGHDACGSDTRRETCTACVIEAAVKKAKGE